jgi:small subunit ribosomal protein S16
MLTIRLTRIGKKNKAQYRIVVQEKSRATSSSYIEQVGFYNPHSQTDQIELKEDRIKHWISKGAEPSPTVHNMLVKQNLIEGKSIPLGRPKKKRSKEEQEEKGETPEASEEKSEQKGEPEQKEEVKEEKPEEKPEESDKKE